jgi:bacillithiol biosynthesis deacetylase BshB1
MELDVLALAAHRDDIELTCAGTLIKLVDRGYRVGIVDLTAGEMGTRGTIEEREQEALEAARIMGVVTRENLHIPDGYVQMTDENERKIIQVIRGYRPQLLFAPYPDWEDRHPDHAHTGRLVASAWFKSGLTKLDTNQPYHRPERMLYYMCHRRFEPTFVVDVTDQHERKMQAIRAFRSQIYNPAYEAEETYISRKEYLEEIEVHSRYYGSLIGKRYGEPFLLREVLEMDDPFALVRGIRT